MRVPEEPAFTCPVIDSTKACIEDAVGELEALLQNSDGTTVDTADAAITDLRQALAELEDIRKANQELRTWGQYWKDEATQRQELLEAAEAEAAGYENELQIYLNQQ